MWPALSITKPEPSACAFWRLGNGKPKNGSTLGAVTTCVAVTCTTPGAALRKIWLTVIALPVSLTEIGPAESGEATRRVVVVPSPKPPSSAAPPRASALPRKAAATSPPP